MARWMAPSYSSPTDSSAAGSASVSQRYSDEVSGATTDKHRWHPLMKCCTTERASSAEASPLRKRLSTEGTGWSRKRSLLIDATAV
jgi:hypothetical protein